MLIRQCLKEREVTLSCELFPPKEGRLLSEYKEIARKVAALRPTFISVTYGAGGRHLRLHRGGRQRGRALRRPGPGAPDVRFLHKGRRA